MSIWKIAVGVFLGIMGVLIVLAIPKWREQSRTDHAEQTMVLLSPDQVIARCGKATKDDSDPLPVENDGAEVNGKLSPDTMPWVRFRTILYEGLKTPDQGNSATVILNFSMSNENPHWLFTSMGVGLNGETVAVTKVEDHNEQIKWLPCLAK